MHWLVMLVFTSMTNQCTLIGHTDVSFWVHSSIPCWCISCSPHSEHSQVPRSQWEPFENTHSAYWSDVSGAERGSWRNFWYLPNTKNAMNFIVLVQVRPDRTSPLSLVYCRQLMISLFCIPVCKEPFSSNMQSSVCNWVWSRSDHGLVVWVRTHVWLLCSDLPKPITSRGEINQSMIQLG